MKHLLHTAFLCLLLSPLTAQTYEPLPLNNTTWVNAFYQLVVHQQPGGPTWFSYELEEVRYFCADDEDTVINSLTYTKINACGGAYKGALRNAPGKVWYVPGDSLTEVLLYDFTAQQGDVLTGVYLENYFGESYGAAELTVTGVDSVLINGDYRKRLWIDNNEGWIEGIGNVQGLFLEPWINVSEYQVELYCMSNDGNTLFPDYTTGTSCPLNVGMDELSAVGVEVYPNPSAGRYLLRFEQEGTMVSDAVLVNATGQSFAVGLTAVNGGYELNAEHLASGLYTVVLTVDGRTAYRKLVKE